MFFFRFHVELQGCTLPQTNSSPLKIGHFKRKRVFQPSIFRCELLNFRPGCDSFLVFNGACFGSVLEASELKMWWEGCFIHPLSVWWRWRQKGETRLIAVPRDPGSPNLKMVMEPKYLSFRRWLDTPIISWEYDDWCLGSDKMINSQTLNVCCIYL